MIQNLNPAEPVYPDVEVHLSTGCDGSIGAVMGKVREALTASGLEDPAAVMDRIWGEIFAASSFSESLNIVMRWVTVT